MCFEDDYMINSLFSVLLNLLAETWNVIPVSDERLHTALNYIHQNYQHPISIHQIAEMLYMDENYFIGFFRQHMNVTPYQYLREYRLG